MHIHKWEQDPDMIDYWRCECGSYVNSKEDVSKYEPADAAIIHSIVIFILGILLGCTITLLFT